MPGGWHVSGYGGPTVRPSRERATGCRTGGRVRIRLRVAVVSRAPAVLPRDPAVEHVGDGAVRKRRSGRSSHARLTDARGWDRERRCLGCRRNRPARSRRSRDHRSGMDREVCGSHSKDMGSRIARSCHESLSDRLAQRLVAPRPRGVPVVDQRSSLLPPARKVSKSAKCRCRAPLA